VDEQDRIAVLGGVWEGLAVGGRPLALELDIGHGRERIPAIGRFGQRPRLQPRPHLSLGAYREGSKHTTLPALALHRMDHVGYVVEDLAAAVAFFVELGMEVEGQTVVEGESVDQLLGLDGVRADLAFLRTPDGNGRVELSAFQSPLPAGDAPRAPVNVPGIPRLTFVVDAVEDALARLRPHGAELVGEVAQFGDMYRYGYVRGPAGVIIGLVEELG
jgi:catechol 2,3-dioxygenase-like lactoylglutathione lyase family enzyme